MSAHVIVTLDTDDGPVELPRQFDDNKQPLPPCTWAVQLWGQPPPYDAPYVPVSLPYHATGDVLRLRDGAVRKLLPRWQIEVHEVWVARAITHDDAMALFRRWGW